MKTFEHLIKTATRLFVEKGYAGTSIRDIAEQSGYTQGAFYSNFDSKEDLLLEMLRRHMQAEAKQLNELVEKKQYCLDEMLNELEVWAQALDQDVNWSMLSIELQLHAQRSKKFAEAYKSIWIQHHDVLALWIDQLFNCIKVVPPVSSQEIASSFMALAHGLSLQYSAVGSSASGRMIVTLLRGLIALAQSELLPIGSVPTG